jgi:hypothetical protein
LFFTVFPKSTFSAACSAVPQNPYALHGFSR